MLVLWGWDLSEPKYYGFIRSPLVLASDASILEISINMKCENCQEQGDLDIYETHKKWHLYHLIPLGTSEHRYHVYCKKCRAFQLTLKKTDIDLLKKKGWIVTSSV